MKFILAGGDNIFDFVQVLQSGYWFAGAPDRQGAHFIIWIVEMNLALSTKEKARDRCMIRSCSNSIMFPNYIVKCSYFLPAKNRDNVKVWVWSLFTVLVWTFFSGCLIKNLGTLVIAHVHIGEVNPKVNVNWPK